MCFLCGKEIGWLRTMVDRQYCSAEHRKEARLASANALREEEEEQEIWSVAKTRKKAPRKYLQPDRFDFCFSHTGCVAGRHADASREMRASTRQRFPFGLYRSRDAARFV